jgi:hypothetical protein
VHGCELSSSLLRKMVVVVEFAVEMLVVDRCLCRRRVDEEQFTLDVILAALLSSG